MGIYIRDMEKPKTCHECRLHSYDWGNEYILSHDVCHPLGRCFNSPQYDGGRQVDTLNEVRPDCPLIEVRDDYFKYYLECERLNDSRDLLKHRGCMECDVKQKCLYAFTTEAEECNHYSNADQHAQCIEEDEEGIEEDFDPYQGDRDRDTFGEIY